MSAFEGSPSARKSQFTIDVPINAPEGRTVETDEVLSVIESLKKESTSKRADYVKKRTEESAQKLYDMTNNLLKLSTERRNLIVSPADISIDLLSKRQQDTIDIQSGIDSGNGDSIAVKNAVCPIKLPEVERIPRYITWAFLDRNQRMTEDQSVIGRRRIYYDQNSGEALIYSDSEEELLEDREEKREFAESEDVMLCSTIQQVGSSDRVLDLLGQCLSRKPSEVKARYEDLVKDKNACSSKNESIQGALNLFLDKDLDAALDSFDSLFCRRCLVFDCKSHGCSQDLIFPAEKQLPWDSPDVDKEPCCPNCYRLVSGSSSFNAIKKESKAVLTSPQFANHGENPVQPSEIDGNNPWRPLEKALFSKGLEMFGRSSCMIARNLMNGLKTCWEVFQYMSNSENKLSQVGDGVNGMFEGSSKDDDHTIMANQSRSRSRFLRRRGRARRLKYTGKSVGYHARRKRISERKDQLDPHYNPCNCQAPCGKECPCIVNGTCCEKYCGCPKSCKNHFRGCLCAKGQCRSRQCPCFAAARECDPDVCRNCWISCGDGTLGPEKGDNYECNNMKLLLKQHQKVLLGRSDVSGWGAFLKNSVGKHEYLGEYTGEIISHHEADKRGTIYDLENSSYLFNLNDQFVLDAYRKGDKLKFANHSPDPNCYPKVIMVAGDHRVGIFAKDKIRGGEELFYDYNYEPNTTPAWAKKPEASTSRNGIIARNLMNGLKTCWEVFQYMNNSKNKLSRVGDGVNGMFEGSFKGDDHTIMANQPRRRSRFLCSRGIACCLSYTGEYFGYHALWKWISERKDKLYRQYNPCDCQAPYGKECPCIVNGTCYMKYCDAQKVARIDFVVVFVPKVSVEADNALALLLPGNSILMFSGMIGSD